MAGHVKVYFAPYFYAMEYSNQITYGTGVPYTRQRDLWF